MTPIIRFRILPAAAIIMILVEVWVYFLGESNVNIFYYRTWHLSQMILLIAVCYAIVRNGTGHTEKNLLSKRILIGLVFSLIGDSINSNLVPLTGIIPIKPQVLMSIPFFAVAHILYIRTYYVLAASKGSIGRRVKITVAIWPFFAVILWTLLIDRERASPLMVYLSFPYACMVSFMALASIWVPMTFGSRGLSVAAGGLIFLASDSLIGVALTREGGLFLSQCIWTAYYVAQILIVGCLKLESEAMAPNA